MPRPGLRTASAGYTSTRRTCRCGTRTIARPAGGERRCPARRNASRHGRTPGTWRWKGKRRPRGDSRWRHNTRSGKRPAPGQARGRSGLKQGRRPTRTRGGPNGGAGRWWRSSRPSAPSPDRTTARPRKRRARPARQAGRSPPWIGRGEGSDTRATDCLCRHKKDWP